MDPEWRADGRELFYVTPDGWMMAAQVNTQNITGDAEPQRLFKVSVRPGEVLQPSVMGRNRYVVTRDGRRFLISYPKGSFKAVHVVGNWRQSRKDSILKP
jgi:hypothetical protein